MTKWTATASVTDFLTTEDARTETEAVEVMRERVATNNYNGDEFTVVAVKRGDDEYRWGVKAWITLPVTAPVGQEITNEADAEDHARFLLSGGYYRTGEFVVTITDDDES